LCIGFLLYRWKRTSYNKPVGTLQLGSFLRMNGRNRNTNKNLTYKLTWFKGHVRYCHHFVSIVITCKIFTYCCSSLKSLGQLEPILDMYWIALIKTNKIKPAIISSFCLFWLQWVLFILVTTRPRSNLLDKIIHGILLRNPQKIPRMNN
jgi:hypothetical protein